jgi:hypothetical protein
MKSNLSKHKRLYKMLGGSEPTTAKINTTGSGPTPSAPPSHVNDDIAAKNSAQNDHAKMGGGRSNRKHGRKSKKHSRKSKKHGRKSKKHSKKSKKHGRKHSRKSKKTQRGGMADAVMCAGAPINSPNGFDYVSPSGCIQVPSVNNSAAQPQAITSSHISYTAQANSQYDDF